MADLDSLRVRVEQAEARLNGVRSTRAHDSDALIEMWNRLRDRFETQEAEIARARALAATLETENRELQAMVEALLDTVEGNLKRIPEDVVPKVASMASELLVTPDDGPVAPAHAEAPAPAAMVAAEADEPVDAPPAPLPAPAHHDAALDASEVEALLDDDDGAAPSAASFDDALLELTDTLDPEPEPDSPLAMEAAPAADGPVGIKVLMTRVKRAMRQSVAEAPPPPPPPSEAELTADEEALGALRRELDGLKAKVASGRRH